MSKLPILLVLIMSTGAQVQMPGHESFHSEFYSRLKIPGTNFSCCGNNDCGPSKHRYLADGTLEMQFRGRWIRPPSARVMRKVTPDGMGHLCAIPWGSSAVVVCAIVPIEVY